MKKTPLLLILGLCGAGLVSGIAARRITRGPAVTTPGMPPVKTKSPGTAKTLETSVSKPVKPATPLMERRRSADTLETLAALDGGSLYARLADWLMDASEQDIAAYWATYQKGKRTNDLTDLVFLNWTRLDPQAAITATAGGKDEHYAWWAWACHDPKGALAAALAANPDRVNNVTWGIGEFHPEWLRAHFKELPESSQGNALAGMSKWDDGENPLETLKFLKENGRDFDEGNFKALAQKDPWAAFDWIKENPGVQSDRYFGSGKDAMNVLVATMSTEHPDDLQRLAGQTPSGELKWKMEAALFESLLATDPAAAVEQAKTTDSPLIAAQRFSKIGLSLLKSDPTQAFEMGKNLLAALSNDGNELRVDYPNGSSSWGDSSDSTAELISALVTKDPARMMEMVAQQGTKDSSSFYSIANQWAGLDLVSYSQWVNRQTDPGVLDSAVAPIVRELTELNQFSEAAEWAMTSNNSRQGRLSNLFMRWKEADPAGASTWLETANLAENERVQLQAILHSEKHYNTDPFAE